MSSHAKKKTASEELEVYRKESARIAKQLQYGAKCLDAIACAKTAFEIDRALISGRVNLQNRGR